MATIQSVSGQTGSGPYGANPKLCGCPILQSQSGDCVHLTTAASGSANEISPSRCWRPSTWLFTSQERREASERSIAQGLALDPQARTRIVEDGLASDPQVGGRAMYEDLTTDLRPALAAITTPTLVIYAYDPTLVFPGGTKPTAEMADATFRESYQTMPNVRLVRIDNSRHFIMTDQPEQLNEQLISFLRVPATPPAH